MQISDFNKSPQLRFIQRPATHDGKALDVTEGEGRRSIDKEGPFVIGVCGGGSSGKAKVCQAILEAVKQSTDGQISYIRLEDFYRPLSGDDLLLADQGRYNFDHPDAVDMELFHKCLSGIINGKSVSLPSYDFTNKQRVDGSNTIHAPAVVIVSGIFLLYSRNVRDLIDLKVFVDVDSDVRLANQGFLSFVSLFSFNF